MVEKNASFWNSNFSIWFWENPKTSTSMISGLLGHVGFQDPGTQEYRMIPRSWDLCVPRISEDGGIPGSWKRGVQVKILEEDCYGKSQENHRGNIKTLSGYRFALFWKICLNNRCKSSREVFCSIFVY